jgi:hypothetical protein
VFNKVNVYEYPALADLGTGYFPGAGFFLQRHRMDVQERGGGLQIERVHAQILLARVAIKPYRPK